MKYRIIFAILLLLAVLALPFLLRKDAGGVKTNTDEADIVVIISAHSGPMKHELEQGFRKYYREKYGRDVVVDWRAPGGTSDIVRYIADRFEAEFRHYWNSDKSNPEWNAHIASSYSNPKVDSDIHADAEAKLARRKFLESEVGIGIDLFAGGGTYDQGKQAARGFAMDGGLQARHPEYFKPDVIPQKFGGDVIYDAGGRYYGVCLASFGICYNADRLKELAGLGAVPPKRWSDLGRPEFFNTVVTADPTKSGSANKCYETILQQAMHEAVPAGMKPQPEHLDRGWADGMNLIKRIMGNTRTITDSAGKVTRDVASGAAAVGMAIDFYGLTEQEWNAFQMGGKPVIFYVAPEGGTAVSADPIQLLRGAPNRKTAHAFLDFMIGLEGQKLLDFKLGTPGGPRKYALRRSPVRMDLYEDRYRDLRADPDYYPYRSGLSFTYHPEWTGRYFSMIRILIRCLTLDVQDELRYAWREIIKAGGPKAVPQAMAEFNRLPFAYREAAAAAASLQTSGTRSAVDVAEVCRKWSGEARKQYLKAASLAKEGK